MSSGSNGVLTRPDERDVRWFGVEDAAVSDVEELTLDAEWESFESMVAQHDSGITARRDLIIGRNGADGYVVSDPVGAAIGTGHSISDAAEDWEILARELMRDLTAFEGRLHSRIQRQLEFLQRTLG